MLKEYPPSYKLGALILCLLICHSAKKPLYQHIWGKYTGYIPSLGDETFINIEQNQKKQSAKIAGYNIEYRLRRKYSVKGRVVFVDWNDGWFNTWYHAARNEGTKLYNAVSPVDLSIIHGKTAEDGNWQKIKFDHEERGLITSYRYDNMPVINNDEINNNHVIPANNAIRKAISIMKVGDIVELEGYLMDWNGTGKFSWFNIETAIEPGELHTKILFGGQQGAGLCRQFYITKISFNGYTFE